MEFRLLVTGTHDEDSSVNFRRIADRLHQDLQDAGLQHTELTLRSGFAGSDRTGPAPEPEPEPELDVHDPADLTVGQIRELALSPAEAEAMLELERAGKNRKGAVEALSARVG